MHYIGPNAVSNVTISDATISSSTLTLTWMEISLTNSDFSHYTVFYLPVRGPYGPIMTSNRRKRQSTQDGELTMNFTGTTGNLSVTGLFGAVTYRIQVAVVGILNGQEITGDRSDAVQVTTLEGSKQTCSCWYIYAYIIIIIITCIIVPSAPRDLDYVDLTVTGVTLTWRRPDPPNGLIIEYNVSDTIDSDLTVDDIANAYCCRYLILLHNH